MTGRHHDVESFFVRLRKIERNGLTSRDFVMLYLIGQQPGIMGNAICKKLGYESRSNIQDNMARLARLGFTEDRRTLTNRSTPNDWHITPAGEALIEDVFSTN